MNINIKQIKIQNFLSYGRNIDENVYTFENGIDLITASNGSGKSVWLDALCYGFFGRPYRKIKLSSLQNNINTKELRVEIYFDVNNKEYKVIRGMNPSIFEIYENDGLLKEEAAIKSYQKILEENIIYTNEDVFRNLIVLGAGLIGSKSFPDLSQKEKEEIFNCLIDTKIFQELTDLSKKHINEHKTLNTEYEYKDKLLREFIDNEKEKILKIKEHNKKVQEKNEKAENEINAKINEIQAKQDKIKLVLDKKSIYSWKYDTLKMVIQDIELTIEELKKEYNKNKEMLLLIESAEKTSIKCENCGTINYTIEIDEDIINSKDYIISKIAKLKEMLLNENTKLKEQKELLDSYKEKNIKISSLEKEYQKNIDLIEDLKKYKEQNNDIIELDIKTYETKVKEYNENKELLFSNKESLEKYKYLNDILSKDKLRGQVISTQIPLLNKFINEFLERFSLNNYNIVINKDFKESIISRNNNIEFQQLSNGQKSRLTFSIMFGFLKLMEYRNTVKWNILVLDEFLDSSFDAEGRSDLLHILKDEFSESKNILIVSHNPEVKDQESIFNREVNIIKDKFSKIIMP